MTITFFLSLSLFFSCVSSLLLVGANLGDIDDVLSQVKLSVAEYVRAIGYRHVQDVEMRGHLGLILHLRDPKYVSRKTRKMRTMRAACVPFALEIVWPFMVDVSLGLSRCVTSKYS